MRLSAAPVTRQLDAPSLIWVQVINNIHIFRAQVCNMWAGENDKRLYNRDVPVVCVCEAFLCCPCVWEDLDAVPYTLLCGVLDLWSVPAVKQQETNREPLIISYHVHHPTRWWTGRRMTYVRGDFQPWDQMRRWGKTEWCRFFIFFKWINDLNVNGKVANALNTMTSSSRCSVTDHGRKPGVVLANFHFCCGCPCIWVSVTIKPTVQHYHHRFKCVIL